MRMYSAKTMPSTTSTAAEKPVEITVAPPVSPERSRSAALEMTVVQLMCVSWDSQSSGMTEASRGLASSVLTAVGALSASVRMQLTSCGRMRHSSRTIRPMMAKSAQKMLSPLRTSGRVSTPLCGRRLSRACMRMLMR